MYLLGEPTKTQYWKQSQQQKWSRFLNKFDISADYQLQPATRHVAQRLYEVIKAKAFWTNFWALSTEERRSDENIVRASIVIDPITKKHANVSIQTPTERVRAQSIELPIRVSPFTLAKRSNSNVRSFGQLIQSVTNFGGAECRVDERRVKTFGILFTITIFHCYKTSLFETQKSVKYKRTLNFKVNSRKSKAFICKKPLLFQKWSAKG